LQPRQFGLQFAQLLIPFLPRGVAVFVVVEDAAASGRSFMPATLLATKIPPVAGMRPEIKP
jgi:hypothetical protein